MELDPTPPPSDPPRATPARRTWVGWLLRLGLTGMLTVAVVLGVAAYQFWLFVKANPGYYVVPAIAAAVYPEPVTVGSVRWTDEPLGLELTSVSIGRRGTAKRVVARMNPDEIWRGGPAGTNAQRIEVEAHDIFAPEIGEVDELRMTLDVDVWSLRLLRVDDVRFYSPQIMLSWDKTIRSSHPAAPVNATIPATNAPADAGTLSDTNARASAPTVSPTNAASDPAQSRAEAAREALERAGLGSLAVKGLSVRNGAIRISDLGPGVPDVVIPFENTFTNVWDGVRPGDDIAKRVMATELKHFTLYSPVYPLNKLVEFETVRIEYTLSGLVDHRLERLALIGPSIYVGQDLFWFTEFLQNHAAQSAPATPSTPWSIRDFSVRGGSVLIASEGQPELELPLVFAAAQSNLVIESVSQLPLKVEVAIPSVSKVYPRYQLMVDNLRGRLAFDLPPGDRKANNVVPVVQVDRVAYREYEASNLWISATFDREKISSDFGGAAYNGYIKGGLYVYYGAFFWTGFVAASGIDLKALADTLTPGRVSATGRASGNVIAGGSSREISHAFADLRLPGSGVIEIENIQQLIDNLPADWWAAKRDIARIGLESFQTYHYHSGYAWLQYSPPTSYLKVGLGGREGARTVDLTYHHLDENPAEARARAPTPKPKPPHTP